jgi:Tfp pilus assembly protein PilV
VTFRTFFRHRALHDDRAPHDDGFALIEVVISAFLVAIIVVGTLTGFDALGRTTADERYHDEGMLLASQSQEQLRSDPASTLSPLEASPHTYTVTVGGETYTVVQEASYVTDSTQHSGCSATGSESTSKISDNYLRVRSTVNWPQLEAAKRPAISQSSIITPPDGSTLEVDVKNGAAAKPEAAVSGVTVVAGGVTTTTGEGGCVVYGSIPSTSVNIEAHRQNYVTESGAYKVSAEEFTIAPNITTHYPITFAQGGRITANFLYKGVKQAGDTFVVNNASMKVSPSFEVGSAAGKFATGELYEPETTTYQNTVTTPVNPTNYATGNLFPFAESSWTVYAGDCLENNPSSISGGKVASGKALVSAGSETVVNVPLSLVELGLYEGTHLTKPEKLETKSKYPVTITNVKCATTTTPNNETKITNVHKQETTTEGHLLHPYQPFGKFKLCMYNASTKDSQEVEYENKEEVGAQPKLYAAETSSYETTVGGTKYKITVKSGNNC